MLKYFSNYNNKNSIAYYFRKKRFDLLLKLINSYGRKKILDIGGFDNSLVFFDLKFAENNDITILNIENIKIANNNIYFIQGDATDPHLFLSNSFDIIHCNSVIEHLKTYSLQTILAQNIQKWGKYYFVQTPNYYFPVEPHFLTPFFQFLPIHIRSYLLTKLNLGHFTKEKDIERARNIVSSIRLMNYKELKYLFPNAKIIKEKFLFFTKSFIIHNFD